MDQVHVGVIILKRGQCDIDPVCRVSYSIRSMSIVTLYKDALDSGTAVMKTAWRTANGEAVAVVVTFLAIKEDMPRRHRVGGLVYH